MCAIRTISAIVAAAERRPGWATGACDHLTAARAASKQALVRARLRLAISTWWRMNDCAEAL